MILHHGEWNGKRILNENSVREMEVNRITPDVAIGYAPGQAEGFGYGYGEWVWKNADEHNAGNRVTSQGLLGSFPWVNNEKHDDALF